MKCRDVDTERKTEVEKAGKKVAEVGIKLTTVAIQRGRKINELLRTVVDCSGGLRGDRLD